MRKIKKFKNAIKTFMPVKVWNLLLFLKKYTVFPFALVKNRRLRNLPLKIYDNKTAVDLIINKRKSLSRYGDGEFNLMRSEDSNIFFQDNSQQLSDDLIRAFKTKNPDILTGFPHIMLVKYFRL